MIINKLCYVGDYINCSNYNYISKIISFIPPDPYNEYKFLFFWTWIFRKRSWYIWFNNTHNDKSCEIDCSRKISARYINIKETLEKFCIWQTFLTDPKIKKNRILLNIRFFRVFYTT
jgi:hypothetical protein